MVSGFSHTVVALVVRPGLLARWPALRRLHLHVRQLPHVCEVSRAWCDNFFFFTFEPNFFLLTGLHIITLEYVSCLVGGGLYGEATGLYHRSISVRTA